MLQAKQDEVSEPPCEQSWSPPVSLQQSEPGQLLETFEHTEALPQGCDKQAASGPQPLANTNMPSGFPASMRHSMEQPASASPQHVGPGQQWHSWLQACDDDAAQGNSSQALVPMPMQLMPDAWGWPQGIPVYNVAGDGPHQFCLVDHSMMDAVPQAFGPLDLSSASAGYSQHLAVSVAELTERTAASLAKFGLAVVNGATYFEMPSADELRYLVSAPATRTAGQHMPQPVHTA